MSPITNIHVVWHIITRFLYLFWFESGDLPLSNNRGLQPILPKRLDVMSSPSVAMQSSSCTYSIWPWTNCAADRSAIVEASLSEVNLDLFQNRHHPATSPSACSDIPILQNLHSRCESSVLRLCCCNMLLPSQVLTHGRWVFSRKFNVQRHALEEPNDSASDTCV